MVRHEDQPESAQGISPDMSVGQAMRMAMEFERTAQAFYQRLAERVHPEARALVLALADEEQKHLALLRDLSLDQDLAKVLAQRHAIPPTQPRFDSFVALCDLPEGSTEDEILTYVESRERIAFEHYGYLAELAPPGPLQNLFAFLREEERGHEADIQARWATTFSVF